MRKATSTLEYAGPTQKELHSKGITYFPELIFLSERSEE